MAATLGLNTPKLLFDPKQSSRAFNRTKSGSLDFVKSKTSRTMANAENPDRPLKSESLSRRVLLNSLAMSPLISLSNGDPALAIATTAVAGRVPGLSEIDSDGLRTYKRPEGKSGGHGIGWSELIPYSFRISPDWDEVPVSIADLGGTEIDLRFQSPKEGSMSVVVAPVLRFSDKLGDNVKIEEIGTPDRIIYAFGPEVTGSSVEGRVKDMAVKDFDGRKYYHFELDPHILISVTAAGNRLYIMTLSSNSRQWKKYSSELKNTLESFRVG